MASRAWWLLGLALMPWPTPSSGQDAVLLTQAEALERAERENPELAAVRERAEARRQRAGASGRAAWPRLLLSADGVRTDNPARVFASRLNRGEFTQDDFAIARLNDPPGLSHLTTALALELPLDVFGKLASRGRTDAAESRAFDAEAAEAVQDLKLRVAEAYQRAALARAALGATGRALAGARAREADIAARVEEGASLPADLLRARARRRQREADRADREADFDVAVAALARLLGGGAGARYEPAGSAAAPGPLQGSLADWQARAAAARPTLLAARERLAGAEWSARHERRSALPDVALYGQAYDDRGGFSRGGQSYALGFSVRWTAFDAGRGRREAAAVADRRASTQDARAAADQTRLEVEAAWRRARAARERYAAAAGGAEDAREALRVIQERRRAGMATLTDELETEAMSLAAELDELRAAADAALADGGLRRAAGEL